jgi:hypothetical protein
MENAENGLRPENRDLTNQEASLVRWLVEHGEPGCDLLLDQVENLKVVSKCNCGCPTIYFELQTAGNSRKGERLVSDWVAEMNDEMFGVMLFEAAGQISSLEVYCCSGRVTTFGLPEIGMIRGYDDSAVDRLAPPPS